MAVPAFLRRWITAKKPILNRSKDRKRARLVCEQLEARVMMHAGDDDPLADNFIPPALVLPDAGAAGTHPLTSVPVLNSRPGSAHNLYLNFTGTFVASWGTSSNVTIPVFDTDGDATTFSDSELATIQEVWQRVSEKYSPFEINVTTVAPANLSHGVTEICTIGGGGFDTYHGGGVCYVNDFTSSVPNDAFVFPDQLNHGYAKYVAEAVTHETGHAFGLNHQSVWSGTTKTQEYNPGTAASAPIMGSSYSATRGLWWDGVDSVAPTEIQDDLSVVSATLGYRAQAEGQTAASATPLAQTGNTASGAGVIEKTSDADFWSFNTGAGAVSFNVNPYATGGMLSAKIALVSASGAVIANGTQNSNLGATVSATVAAGSYRVEVLSNGGYGDIGQYTISGTDVGLTTPTSPDPFTATAITNTRIDLSWTASTGATGYALFKLTGTTYAQFTTVAANVTTYSVTGLTPGTTYWFYVAATNASGSTKSQEKSAVTSTLAVPTSPDPLILTAPTATQINLSWTASQNASGYDVFDWFNNAWRKITTSPLPATTTTYQVTTGLSPSTTYWYYVSALNSAGHTDGTYKSVMTPALALKPASPEPLTLTVASSSEIDLSWTAAAGATSYTIHGYNNATGATTTIVSNFVGISYHALTFDGTSALAPSTLYWFYVDAVNNNGTTSTAWKSATTLGQKPASPEPLTLTVVSTSEIDLSWKAAAGATSYVVHGYNNATNVTTTIATLNSPIASSFHTLTFDGATALAPSTLYWFYVDAVNGNGITSTTWKSATTLAAGPAAPGNFTVTAISTSRIDLAWSSVKAADGYKIFDWTGTGWHLTTTLTAGATSYSVTGLSAGTTYSYFVEAYNSTGVGDAMWKSATTFLAAPEPLVLTVKSTTEIDLSWHDVAGRTGFKVYEWNGSAWAPIATITAAPFTSFAATGLTANTTYYFYVSAFSTANHADTNWKQATTPGTLPSSPDPLIAAATSPTTVHLTWTASAGATGYDIYQWNGSSWGSPINHIGVPTVTVTDVAGLSPNSTYYFYVAATNGLGATAGQYQAVKTPSAAPGVMDDSSFTVTAVSGTEIDLSWGDVANETGFHIYRWNGQTAQWDLIQTTSAGQTTYADTGLTPSTTYFYYVSAFNTVGASSVKYQSDTTWATGPDAASSLTATAISGSEIDLDWSPPFAAISGYHVYQWTGSTWVLATGGTLGPTATSYQATGLSGGTTYFFYVQAFSAGGVADTDWVSATTTMAAPVLTAITPDNGDSQIGFSHINLSWTSVSGATGYDVDRYDPNAQDWITIAAVGSNQLTYSDSGLSSGTTYFYTVQAFNDQTSQNSNPAQSDTWVSVPTPWSAVAASRSSVLITWTLFNTSAPATGFRIYEWNGVTSSWFVVQDNLSGAQSSTTVSGLNAKTTYYFEVQAFNNTSHATTGWESVVTLA